MTTPEMMIVIGIGLTVIFLMLLVWFVRPLFIERKERIARLRHASYPVACAGSQKEEWSEEEESVSVDINEFYDNNGKRLNPEDYLQFVVNGNSMKFCGIHDKDLLFVAKGFRVVQLTKFPYILVIRRHDAKPGQSAYKVRRAWGIAYYGEDRFEKELKKILASEDFKNIKSLKGKDGKSAYPGDEEIIDDFLSKRLPKYEAVYLHSSDADEWNKTVVLSTTFSPEDGSIHFSIHPIALIIGIVTESYTVTG